MKFSVVVSKEVHLPKLNNYDYSWREYSLEFKVQEHHIWAIF